MPDLEREKALQPTAPLQIAVNQCRACQSRELKSFWFQVRGPMNGDEGMTEPAFYSVFDGVLTMRDETKSRPVRMQVSARRRSQENCGAAGERGLAEGGRQSDFNRPLEYQPYRVA